MPISTFTRQSIRATGLAWLLAGLACQHAGVDAAGQDARAAAFDRMAQADAMGYRWLRWSTGRIGHRLTGSPGGTMAEQAADSLFRLSGLERVQAHPFTARAWSRGTVGLSFGQGDARFTVPSVALANTPAEALAEAPLVDAGNGLPDDLDRLGDRVRGAAVLLNIGLAGAPEGTRNLHRSEKAKLAMDRGAAALIFVNRAEGRVLLTGTASIDGATIAVPAACIAAEDGAMLRERLAGGAALTARLRMANRIADVQARNIIAEIPGSARPEEVILIGGHLDSWDLATGATDNGLGAFSILDLARAMAAMPQAPERTVRFVLFMGEEQGLLGSRALVEHYRATGELARIKCMVNLDMSGHPQGFGVGGPPAWAVLLGRACRSIRAVDSTAFEGRVSEEVWLHSDHQPFLLAGVPVIYPLCDLGEHAYSCYHSDCDDIHLVDPQAMVDNVRFVGALAYALAAEPELPAGFTEEGLRARLIEVGLEQPLRIGGDWPWP